MMTSSLLSSHLLPVLLLLLLSPTRASNDFPRACQSPHDTYPFCDTSKSYESRVSDLVGRLTLGEKVLQMDNTAPSVPRLGIPAYQWWSEALHGVNSRCDPVSGRCPTSFPAGMNLGASFDPKLWTSVGQAIGDEARALRSAGVRNFLNATFGLDVWMPNLNVFRDPRWGRGQETPGEDPYLTGQYAKYMISAVQGNLTASPYVKLVATAKHFDAYSLELWHGMDRHHFDAVVSAQDLNQTYYPAFRDAVVEGGVLGVMCSYNSVNGVPACANNFLQKELRDSWGFDGYVTSDCGAIQDIYATHNYTKTPQEASAVSVKAGTDVDCGDVYGASLQAAVQQGLITEAEIDVSLSRLFMIRMRTGMFDPLDVQPYVNYTIDVVNSQKHRDLARSAACKGIVLLKNEPVAGASEPLLPLDDSQPLKVALIGPNANATTTLCSNYFGGLPYIVSPFAAINARSSVTVQYEKGCDVVGTDKSGFAAAVDAASKAEVAIVILGLDQQVESEGHDRDAIDLPGVQEDLLQAVMAAQPNTVLVLINGGPVAIEWAAAKVPAIVEAFYPGEEGGTCIAEVLFGEYSPSARLPVTIYPAGYVDEVSMLSMDMRKSPGRTYRFYTGTPIYEFGHGLSYSQWKYSVVPADGATLVPTVSGAANVTFNVSVTNLGPHTASMTVLLFITTPSSAAQECPLKQLFFFTEVTMAAPDTHVFQVQASGADAGCYDSSGGHVVPAGEYVVSVEDSRASFVVA